MKSLKEKNTQTRWEKIFFQKTSGLHILIVILWKLSANYDASKQWLHPEIGHFTLLQIDQ